MISTPDGSGPVRPAMRIYKAENVKLKAGVNTVILKTINESNNWQGSIRFKGADGKPAFQRPLVGSDQDAIRADRDRASHGRVEVQLLELLPGLEIEDGGFPLEVAGNLVRNRGHHRVQIDFDRFDRQACLCRGLGAFWIARRFLLETMPLAARRDKAAFRAQFAASQCMNSCSKR